MIQRLRLTIIIRHIVNREGLLSAGLFCSWSGIIWHKICITSFFPECAEHEARAAASGHWDTEGAEHEASGSVA